MKYSYPIGKVLSGNLNIPNRCVGFRGKTATIDENNTKIPLPDMYEPVPISLNTVVRDGITYLEGEVPQGGYNFLASACEFMTSSDFKIDIDPNFRKQYLLLDSQNGSLAGSVETVDSSFPKVPSLTIIRQNPSRILKLIIDQNNFPMNSFGVLVSPFVAIDQMGNTNTETKTTYPCTLTITSKTGPVPQTTKIINVEIIGTPYSWGFDYYFNEGEILLNGTLILECPIQNANELLGAASSLANVWVSNEKGAPPMIQTAVRFERVAAMLGSDSYSIGSTLTGLILLASAFAYFF